MSLRALVLVSCLSLLACNDTLAPAGDGDTNEGSDHSGETDTDSDTSTDATDTTETDTTEPDTTEPPGNLFLSDEVLNIAHRGGRELRPEATLTAFGSALTVGADVLEFDIHASSDGVLVVMHDDTVDRTTDGSGLIKELSFDELRMLDAGYSFTLDGGETHPYRGMGIQIPTPGEIFEAFPDQYYMIEIKQEAPSIVSEFLSVIADHDAGSRLIIASFSQVTLDEVRAAAPEQMTSMSAIEMVNLSTMGSEPGYAPPAFFIQAPWELVTQDLVDMSHGLGIKVHPWTVNSEALMQDMLGYGVDGIITDDPELLDGVLGG